MTKQDLSKTSKGMQDPDVFPDVSGRYMQKDFIPYLHIYHTCGSIAIINAVRYIVANKTYSPHIYRTKTPYDIYIHLSPRDLQEQRWALQRLVSDMKQTSYTRLINDKVGNS